MTRIPMGYADLHIHTTASDGTADIGDLLDFVAKKRPYLNVIAITDHDTLDAALWAHEQQHNYRFEIVPDVEVSSNAGHILALWVTKPIPTKMDLDETAAAIRESGGISVLAHPFHIHMEICRKNARRYLMQPEVLLDAGIDAIEVHNAGIVTPVSNGLSRRLARKLGMAVTGSSDAHTPGAVGSGATRFVGSTAAELRHSLENAHTQAEGRPWPIMEYIRYFQSMSASGEISSSENMNSYHQTSA